MTTQTAGIYLLGLNHAEAIEQLASAPEIAATTRIPHPYPSGAARSFIESRIEAREHGTAWCFAIVDRKTVVGLVGLEGIEGEVGNELGYWIGRPHWGKGYATFGVKMVLEFAFRNLHLQKIYSAALESNAASRRVLEKNGFRLTGLEPHSDALLKRPDELLARYEATQAEWKTFINAATLAGLHPGLRILLEAELAAGNEIVETRNGWPDANSIFVRLRHPFRTRVSPLPADVHYAEQQDPHGWKAEFSSRRPRHILAH